MDLWRLKIFCSVVEHGSFSKAADAVSISQPTVSSHIKDLEEYFGCRLIDRFPRRIELTRAGAILYEEAKLLLAQTERLKAQMAESAGKISGSILIAGSTIPGCYILPMVIGKFSADYPEVFVSLKIADTFSVVKDIAEGKCELGVVGAEINDRNMIQRPLAEDQLCLVVPAGHPFSEEQEVCFDMLVKEPFISREPGSGTRRNMEKSLKRAGFNPDRLSIVAEMGSTSAVKQAIKQGVGISVLSHLAVKEDVEARRLCTLSITGVDMRRFFYLTESRYKSPSPPLEMFANYLLSYPGLDKSQGLIMRTSHGA